MDLAKIEEAMKKVVESLDRGSRLEAVVEEEGGFRVIISKGTHSDRATLSKELLTDFLEQGKRGHEVKKVIGKVVSKLRLTGQRAK